MKKRMSAPIAAADRAGDGVDRQQFASPAAASRQAGAGAVAGRFRAFESVLTSLKADATRAPTLPHTSRPGRYQYQWYANAEPLSGEVWDRPCDPLNRRG
jgi:hypothetical protein